MGSNQSKVRASWLIAFISTVLLAACSSSDGQPTTGSYSSDTNEGFVYQNNDWQIMTIVPNGFAHSALDNEGMYFGYATTHRLGHFTIQIHKPSSISCSPSITGASRTSPLETTPGKTNWGRVDAYDTPESLDREPVLCSPPKVSWLIDAEGNAKLESSAYALCSEKDGKTVVICIGQMTDNPEMAKQIFETFRWVE